MLGWFCVCVVFFFFFNDTATTEIYTTRHTLSLHDALPISAGRLRRRLRRHRRDRGQRRGRAGLRSEEHTSELQSRLVMSYAVFCLKKKKPVHGGAGCVPRVPQPPNFTYSASG